MHRVQRAFVSKEVRGASEERLAKLLNRCRLSLNHCGDDYSIKVHPRLKGGAPPLLAASLYMAANVATGEVLVTGGVTAGAVALSPLVGVAIAGGVGVGALGYGYYKLLKKDNEANVLEIELTIY